MCRLKADFERDLIVQSLLVSEMRGLSAGYLCNVILGKLSARQRIDGTRM